MLLVPGMPEKSLLPCGFILIHRNGDCNYYY